MDLTSPWCLLSLDFIGPLYEKGPKPFCNSRVVAQTAFIMNLMFRKNFREQKGGVTSKIIKASANRHTSKRVNREQGYTPMEEHHYRTHLFFSPPRSSNYTPPDDLDGKPSSSFYFAFFELLAPTFHTTSTKHSRVRQKVFQNVAKSYYANKYK